MKWKVMDESGEMHMFDSTEEMVAFVKDNLGCVIQAIHYSLEVGGNCENPSRRL